MKSPIVTKLESIASETVEVTTPILLISLLSAIVFGAVDALNFLFVEEGLSSFLESTNVFPNGTIPLAVGGLSTAISVLISVYIRQALRSYSDLLESPYIDATGVIIGTLLIILFVKLYTNLFPTVFRRKTETS
jgi:hypothetical protein